ncbi:MAG: hypothetical protein QMD10_12415 [Desulfitobacteriaceae bacterium]|nr:hypothetical protein [Desulfitobacteriaceae bacterium]
MMGLTIYISSSWKNKEQVRLLADRLREKFHRVYDFTDPKGRMYKPIPPEEFPEEFDPEIHCYKDYLFREGWFKAVTENRLRLGDADVVLLLLPAGNDAHADWGFAVGRGKWTAVIGRPRKGERTPTHLWAHAFFETVDEFLDWFLDVGGVYAVSDWIHRQNLKRSEYGLVMEALHGPNPWAAKK